MASKTSTPLRFGTSGWRAIIADEFTVANARRVVAAIARHVVSEAGAAAGKGRTASETSREPSLVIGYDPRFLSETFAAHAAEEAARHGIRCYLSPDSVPTPTIAFAIRKRKADGGINFTASHNPAEYNGIKFSMSNGAPALPEVTRKIEAEIAKPSAVVLPASPAPVEPADLRGNGDVAALNYVYGQIEKERAQDETIGKAQNRLRLIVACSDGGPDDPTKVQEYAEALGKLGAVVVGVGLTDTARAVPEIYNTPHSRGDIVKDINDLPAVVAKHLVAEAIRLFPARAKESAKAVIEGVIAEFQRV